MNGDNELASESDTDAQIGSLRVPLSEERVASVPLCVTDTPSTTEIDAAREERGIWRPRCGFRS